MRALLAACLLSWTAAPAHLSVSSVPERRCTTTCGVVGDFDAGECEALNIAEARTLRAYADLVPAFRPGYASCMMLDGWTVQVHVRTLLDTRLCEGGWVSPSTADPSCIIGLTQFETRTITVADKAFAFNALAHEVGHVLEHAFDYRGPRHCGWRARGIDAAIERVTGEHEDSEEKCYFAADGGD